MAEAEVVYCYRCGKHVRREPGRCWYCAAETHRVIRPPRRCSFCDEVIGANAVKCPHCGEFLDGSSRPPAQPPPQPPVQVTFQIDKAVIQGAQPPMLDDGQAAGAAHRLPPPQPRPIGTESPGLLDRPDAKALPAPDRETSSPEEGAPPPTALPSPRDAAAPARGDRAVERREDLAPAMADSTRERKRFPLLRRAGGALMDLAQKLAAPPPSSPEEEVADAEFREETSRYAACAVCRTEVLAADNYCFHCGTVLNPEAVASRSRRRGPALMDPTVFGVLFLALLVMIGMVFFGRRAGAGMPGAPPDERAMYSLVGKVLAGISLLLVLGAFFHRRTSLSQIVAILFGLIWIVCLALAYPF